MFDPIVTRLVGCMVFAGLLGTLLMTAVEPYDAAPRDVVKVAQLQKSVEKMLLTRQ